MIEASIQEEYFHLQETVEAFDSKSLTIKAWSVTLSMAGIGAAYVQAKPLLLMLAGVSALLFWLIEGLWKTFQYAYYARIKCIETYCAGQASAIKPLQITTSWSASWQQGGIRRFARVMAWPHVVLPHGVVFLGGLGLYLLQAFAGGV